MPVDCSGESCTGRVRGLQTGEKLPVILSSSMRFAVPLADTRIVLLIF